MKLRVQGEGTVKIIRSSEPAGYFLGDRTGTCLKGLLGCLILLLYPTAGYSQMSMGGSPLKSSAPEEVEWINLETVRVDELMLEDEWISMTGRKNQRFATEIQVSVQPGQTGTWKEYPNGTLVWRAGIRGKGARALGLEFSRYVLEPGVKLFIYDPAQKHVLGAYTDRNNKQNGSLPVSFLPGDELILQMEVPPQCDDYGELQLGFVRWAYLPVITNKSVSDGYFGNSGPCNVDINCSLGDDWQVQKNAVLRLITATEKCTGVLINNTRQDSTAYVYTAAHCVFQDNKYQNPIFYFHYESPYCDGPDGSTEFSISGATLIATGDTLENPRDADSLDFALLKLSVAPPAYYQPYFIGWNRSSTPAQHTTTIHHPAGDVKKIAIDTDPPVNNYHNLNYFPELVRFSHWRIVKWDIATTEFGSSGCPLFDQNQLLVGTLTGGQATCTYPYNDYFTRFDYAWDYYPEPTRQIKHWLDPDDTGVMSLGGLAGWAVGTGSIKEAEEISLFPNPAGDLLNVQSGLARGREAGILVYDLTGKLVLQKKLAWQGEATLDVSGIQPGLYILRFRQGDSTVTRRFLISR
jgi:lysyl endopeptidase